MVDDLIVDWLRLRCILGRCKELLRTRRSKKAGEQRRKILLDVWPSMSLAHRPDFRVVSRESYGQVKDALVFPHVSLEGLVKSKALLLFLDSPTCHTSNVFA